eukprot:7378871-Prymnesium_polylepis.1
MIRQTALHSWGINLRVVAQNGPRAARHRRHNSQTAGTCSQILKFVLHGLHGHVVRVASQLDVNCHAVRASIAQ